jgi:4-hydroxy-tetrahydrodipicolinate synthase
MAHSPFKGVIPALVTPFRDGAVDEKAFVALVERQIAGGVHGLVPVGTTGETATLSHEEHKRVVELCVQTARGRVPVIAGAGSNSTAEAIELVAHAKAVGADAALVVSPYYVRPSQEGVYQHYKAINDAVQLPVLVYNVPGRTGSDVTNETLERLSKLPNIVGIKDATGDMVPRQLPADHVRSRLGDAVGRRPHGAGLYRPRRPRRDLGDVQRRARRLRHLHQRRLQGEWETALYWQDRLVRLHKALFLDASPSPTKFAMAHLGLCEADVRLPIAPCSDAVKPAILEAMHEAGLV